MENPWKSISLETYEAHMALNSVRQLQTLSELMKEQLDAYDVRTAMILGVAGGNGLEHVRREKYETVWGVDLNREYLRAAEARHRDLAGILRLLALDLTLDAERLPRAELVIADLLIEYIGYDVFQNVIKHVQPRYVSCAIQINDDVQEWVSDSPYLHAFDGLDAIHHQMEPSELTSAMAGTGYRQILQAISPLPNAKKLMRLDFECFG